MCGIAGWVDWQPKAKQDGLLQAMADALVHRGPDGDGYYEDGPVALAHRRLSIIDLDTGAQPMANEDETVWIVFNGEIFNFQQLRDDLVRRGHRFKTRSDTETIVHLYEQYGADCVDHLRGQFAFAVWDSQRQQLFLARDRMGQKPLFYRNDQRRFVFSSELPSLLEDRSIPRDVDPVALDLFMTYRYVPDPYSIIAGVRKLPPAHTLTVSARGVELKRYWKATFGRAIDVTEDDALEQLDGLLEEATRLRMIADVPLGAFLSGGIDSSLVVAYMARVSEQPVRTYCIGFEEEAYDERTYAREVAKRFGTEHHEFVVRPEAADVLPKMVRFFGEPFADESGLAVYYLAKMTRQDVTVALNGDGGDESFAGYRRYQTTQWASRYLRLPGWIRSGASSAAAALIAAGARDQGMLRRLHRYGNVDGPRVAACYELAVTGLSGDRRRAMYTEDFRARLARLPRLYPMAAAAELCDSENVIDRCLHTDQMTYLPGDLLVKVDRMTMAHGLEGRSPLLDHMIVEFAASLPTHLKLHGTCRKYLLKKLLERKFGFSSELVHREKQGFAVPVRQWLCGDLRELLEDSIRASTLVTRGIFRREAVLGILDEHLSGKANRQTELWSFLNLELWNQQFGAG